MPWYEYFVALFKADTWKKNNNNKKKQQQKNKNGYKLYWKR